MQIDNTIERRSYHPSGKIAPAAWLYLALLGLFILPALAYAYAFLTFHAEPAIGNFFELTNPILAILLGYSVARLADTLVVRRGRVRHPRFALCVGAGSALWVLYLHWLFWVHMVIAEEQMTSLWTDWCAPALLWSRIVNINSTGTWVMVLQERRANAR